MPRTPIIAGNWKMNTLRADAVALARAIRERRDGVAGVEKIVCPPFVFLHDVAAAVAGSTVAGRRAERVLGREGRLHRRGQRHAGRRGRASTSSSATASGASSSARPTRR